MTTEKQQPIAPAAVPEPDGDPETTLQDIWKYYEFGRSFNSSLVPDQYSVARTNTDFFNGNQWESLPDTDASRRLAKPVFNIIKRITSLFVASLTSSRTVISFSALAFHDDLGAAEFATAEVRNLLEKFKMDYRIRDALFDGAITGDYCAHFFLDPHARPYGGACGEARGEIEMELLDGVNVMFGDPNVFEVEKQPYIIIVGRDTVEHLEREAQRHAAERGESFVPHIMPDACTDETSNLSAGLTGTDKRNSKAKFLYYYTKKRRIVEETGEDGVTRARCAESVHVSKVTRGCVIYADVDTGLSRYPVAWGNWQRQKNCYHGRALVTEVIPNQIFINEMMAMVFRHLQTQAFPTRIYNADLLPYLTNEVGAAIGVRNLMPGQELGSVVSVIPSTDMSGQIIQTIDLCLQYTKECLGATDAQLGNLQANNTSAIMVLQNASEVPLENTRAGLHEWLEDAGAILLDMMGTYYGVRPVLTRSEEDGKEVMRDFDFSVFKKLWFNISVDVGAANYYSEIAAVQTLDNLRREGVLELADYLERVPDSLIPRKEELLNRLKENAAMPPAQPRGDGAEDPSVTGTRLS